MQDSSTLEIIQENPANEVLDNEVILARPPSQPHADAPDKYDYLHQVP